MASLYSGRQCRKTRAKRTGLTHPAPLSSARAASRHARSSCGAKLPTANTADACSRQIHSKVNPNPNPTLTLMQRVDLMWQAEVERALEHCYDIDTKRWVQREILIRADLDRIVGSGAMRQCFQTKILHQDIKQHDWQRLREKPMQAVVPGIGAKTSRWLGVALLGPGAQDLRIG